MKKLLFFLMIFAGINCQAQHVKFGDRIYFSGTAEVILKLRIDSLEKRVISLEKKVDEYLQDSIIEHSLFQTSKWETNNKTSDLVYKPMIRGISVQDLFDYQKECYNDSTFVDTYWRQIDNGTMAYVTEEVMAHYIHKEPIFEGFIEYIKQLKETDK